MAGIRGINDDGREVRGETDLLFEGSESKDRAREEEARLERANDLQDRETVQSLEQDHIEQMVVRDFSVAPEKRLDQARDLAIVDDQEFVAELKAREPELKEEEIERIAGFQDSRDSKAFVREGEFSEQWLTSIHEKLHQKSQSELPRAMNEGVTEYLARKEAGWTGELHNYDRHGNEIPRRSAYDGEVEVINKLVARVGDAPLKRAYFQGDTASLQQRVDAELGRGAFVDLCNALEQKDFQRASKRIRNRFVW